jgi:serine/threonine protein kinase
MLDAALAVGSVVAGRYRVVGPCDERPTFMLLPVEALDIEKAGGPPLTLLAVHELLTRDPTVEARFLRDIVNGDFSSIEGRITKPIDGGVDRAEGLAWLVFETPWGTPLEKVVATGLLPLQEVGALLRELASALSVMHAAGFANGALSPECLWYKPAEGGGQPVVTQLVPGLVNLIAEGLKTKPAETRAGFALPKRTVAYLPPETIAAAAVQDPAPKDVWAFGLLAFELFIGCPFWKRANDEDATLLALMNEIMSESIESASTRASGPACRSRFARQFSAPTLPPAFDTFFRSCVKREPWARLTMREVEEDVRRWTPDVLASPVVMMPVTIVANPKGSHYDAGLVPKPAAPSPPPPPKDDGRGRLRLVFAIAFALVVLAIVITVLARQR